MRSQLALTPFALSLLFFGCDPQPNSPEGEMGGTARGGINIVGGSPPPAGDQLTGGQAGAGGVEEGPLFNSILPTRASRAGGTDLRVIGGEFRAPMEVLVGGEPCVSLRVESVSRLRCELPPWPEPAVVDVSVAWLNDEGELVGARQTLSEALTYYEEVRLSALEPSVGPAQGSTEVTLTGEGFEEPTDVRFGGLPALSVEVVNPQTIIALTPPSTPRLADVTVQNANGSSALRGGFRWTSPIEVERVEPSWTWSTGGEPIALFGYGLYEDARVSLNNSEARLISASEPTRLTVEAPPSSPGWATLSLTSGNGEVNRERALLYLDPTPGAFDVLGLTPARLPSDEGGYFVVGGNGFSEQTEVRVAGERASCELLAPQRLRCFTPSRPVSVVPVEVRDSAGAFAERRTLNLSFYARLALYDVSPPRAATVGGALLKLSGRGFDEGLEVKVSDLPAEVVSVPSATELWIKAPPHPIGLADVSVSLPSEAEVGGPQVAFLPESITYFDPTSRYGGAWGDPIERSVNVTALNIYDLSPIEGVRVEARPFDALTAPALVAGSTDEGGQVTLSSQDLLAPIAVTGFKLDYEVVSVERVVSENVTLVMIPFEPPPEGEGNPPEGPPPALITGRLEGLSALPKPLEDDVTLRGFIDVSHPSMLGKRMTLPPSPNGILAEDGDFELMIEPGQVTLVATAAYVQNWALNAFNRGQMSYWTMRQYSRPISMGLVRHISLSGGAELRDVLMRLRFTTDAQASTTLLNPALAPQELNEAGEPIAPTYSVRAFLNLGAEGYWELDVAEESEGLTMRVTDLPRMEELPSDINLEWYAMARVNERATTVAYHTQRELSREVRLGPMVGVPYITSHTVEDLIRVGDTIRWSYWPGVSRPTTEPPEVVRVRLIQGGRPIWSYTLPGGLNELTIPPLNLSEARAEGEGGILGLYDGPLELMFEPMTSHGRFDYQDFTLLDLFDARSTTTVRYPLTFTVFPEGP